MTTKYLLSAETLDERAVVEHLDASAAGAIVTFVGRVRSKSRGRNVTKLEYDAYPEMAESIFSQIADETVAKFEIGDIAIHHRVGMLDIGDVSVVIAVAAPHRGAAFDACRYAIDRLKQTAPIWKKEHAEDGAVWVEDRP